MQMQIGKISSKICKVNLSHKLKRFVTGAKKTSKILLLNVILGKLLNTVEHIFMRKGYFTYINQS